MKIFEVTLKEGPTLGGFPVKVLNIEQSGVDQEGVAEGLSQTPFTDEESVVINQIFKQYGHAYVGQLGPHHEGERCYHAPFVFP